MSLTRLGSLSRWSALKQVSKISFNCRNCHFDHFLFKTSFVVECHSRFNKAIQLHIHFLLVGSGSLWKSPKRWIARQKRHNSRHRIGWCARLRWCDEITDQGRWKWQNCWCKIQNIRLCVGHCVQFIGHRMGERQNTWRGWTIEEHRYCQGAVVAASETALFEWVH